jgi:lambda family phage portal protein
LSNINASTAAGLHTMRARAGHAVLNDPHAARAAAACVANVVGQGIKPQSTAADAEAIDSVFAAWAGEADAAGRTDFYGLQAAVALSVFVAGEAFVRLRPRRPEDGLTVPLQLELLDPAQVDAGHHRELGGGFAVRSGIEFDPLGRRVAYHVARQAPGDPLATGIDVVRVPAADMLHVYEPLAPGQVRGVSRLAPVLLRLRDLDELGDAALMRAKIEAMFAAFLVDPDGSAFGDATADGSLLTSGLEPGTVKFLPPGADIKFATPDAGGENYAPFVAGQLRAIASGLGLTYEQLSGDMTGVNYSSARVALIEFRRAVEAWRAHVLVPQLLDPVWRRVLQTAALAGALPADVDAGCTWVAPAWDWVDPLKDTQADALAVEQGFKSKRQVIREWGLDPDRVAAEIAEERTP